MIARVLVVIALSFTGSACCRTAEGCGQLDVSGTWTETVSDGSPGSVLVIENQEGKTDVEATWSRNGVTTGEEPALRSVLLPWDRLDAASQVGMAKYSVTSMGVDNLATGRKLRLWIQSDRAYPCVPRPGERYCNLYYQLDLSGSSASNVISGDMVLIRQTAPFSSDKRTYEEVGRVPIAFTRDTPIEEYEECVCLETASTDGGVDAGM